MAILLGATISVAFFAGWHYLGWWGGLIELAAVVLVVMVCRPA